MQAIVVQDRKPGAFAADIEARGSSRTRAPLLADGPASSVPCGITSAQFGLQRVRQLFNWIVAQVQEREGSRCMVNSLPTRASPAALCKLVCYLAIHR
jgi:hypothetical protein